MKLNDLTVRTHAKYLSLVDEYDQESGAVLVRAVAFVMAARDAGIATDLPEEYATGDLMALPPQHTGALVSLGVLIAQHVNAQTAGPDVGES